MPRGLPYPRALHTLVMVVAMAAGALLFGACGEDAGGSLTLVIDTTAAELDPLADPRVARLTLYDNITGATLGDTPYDLGERLRLASLAPGTRDLRLDALSATNQVLATARGFDISVARGTTRSATLHLRKPLAYVGGGPDLEVSNTAIAAGESEALDPIPLGGVRALATTRSGDLLLATVDSSSGSAFVWLDTATHEELGRVPLGSPVREIVVHPRDHYLALLQNLGNTILLVDVARLRAGGDVEGAFGAISVPMPLAASFAADETLWVLSATPANCDGPLFNPGQLLHLDLDGNPVETAVPLPAMANDVTMNPVSGRPLVTLACSDQVVELADDAFTEVLSLHGVGDVVVEGESLYAVGWDSPTSPDLLPGVVAIRDLGTDGTTRRVVFPIESVPLTLGETDEHGNYKYLYVAAVTLSSGAVSVTAPGSRVAFLHTITYQLVTDFNDTNTGIPICNELVISLVEQGVTLVDLETGQIVWSRPTSLENRCTCDHSDLGVCIKDLDQSLDGPAFAPTALTLLTGGR